MRVRFYACTFAAESLMAGPMGLNKHADDVHETIAQSQAAHLRLCEGVSRVSQRWAPVRHYIKPPHLDELHELVTGGLHGDGSPDNLLAHIQVDLPGGTANIPAQHSEGWVSILLLNHSHSRPDTRENNSSVIQWHTCRCCT